MIIEIMYNTSEGKFINVITDRKNLSKKLKIEIKEAVIDGLEYKHLSVLCKIRSASIKRAEKEFLKYCEKYFLTVKDIESVIV